MPNWSRNIVLRTSWKSGQIFYGYRETTPTWTVYFGLRFLSERTGVPASVVSLYVPTLIRGKTQHPPQLQISCGKAPGKGYWYTH